PSAAPRAPFSRPDRPCSPVLLPLFKPSPPQWHTSVDRASCRCLWAAERAQKRCKSRPPARSARADSVNPAQIVPQNTLSPIPAIVCTLLIGCIGSPANKIRVISTIYLECSLVRSSQRERLLTHWI